MFDNTPFTGFERDAPTVVGYGDLHGVYLAPVGQRTLFNVGSVGNPLDDTTASYAVLEGELGDSLARSTSAPWSIAFRRVPYDIEREIAIARDSGMPGVNAYAIELRTGVYRRDHDALRLTAGF
jgi:diadenosine tetraphosphatase ApaH/serine/threonine PP2A family protein phosphatase